LRVIEGDSDNVRKELGTCMYEVFITRERGSISSLPDFSILDVFVLFIESSLFARVSDFTFCCMFRTSRPLRSLNTPVCSPGGRVFNQNNSMTSGRRKRVYNSRVRTAEFVVLVMER
jgi:hypothetical protein